ncbi:hypothetical protein RSOL_141160, partial [Rhizoctonia solani AG-3 Rhs1AP]
MPINPTKDDGRNSDECPTFRAECSKFNTRCPENRSALFGPSRPYDPRLRPINYPLPPPIPEMLIGGGRPSLLAAQGWDIRNVNRRPNWTSRELPRKEMGYGEAWDNGLVRTAPLAPLTGSNAATYIPSRLPGQYTLHAYTSAPAPQQRPSAPPARSLTPPLRSYSPSMPVPTTPVRASSTVDAPATPTRALGNHPELPYDISPVFYARRRAVSAASPAIVTQ